MRLTVFAFCFCVVVTSWLPPAAAQQDHLHCYGIDDPLQLEAVINLTTEEFGLEDGCDLGNTIYFCSPANKDVVEAVDGSSGEPISRVILAAPPPRIHQICYQLRCPASATETLEVTDQFGTRSITLSRQGLLCTPTMLGAPDHRVAFVTSRLMTGEEIGGLAGADSICAELALEAGLAGEFMAWISDSSGSPDTRFTKSLTPYVRTDGIQIATSYVDLTSGLLDAPLLVDETGQVITGGFRVWTGTVANGTANGNGPHRTNCRNWTTSNLTGTKGESGETRHTWSASGGHLRCTSRSRLYCFEQ